MGRIQQLSRCHLCLKGSVSHQRYKSGRGTERLRWIHGLLKSLKGPTTGITASSCSSPVPSTFFGGGPQGLPLVLRQVGGPADSVHPIPAFELDRDGGRAAVEHLPPGRSTSNPSLLFSTRWRKRSSLRRRDSSAFLRSVMSTVVRKQGSPPNSISCIGNKQVITSPFFSRKWDSKSGIRNSDSMSLWAVFRSCGSAQNLSSTVVHAAGAGGRASH